MDEKWDRTKQNMRREKGLEMASRKAIEQLKLKGCKGIKKIGAARNKTFLAYTDKDAKHYVEVRFLLNTKEYARLNAQRDAHRDLYAAADKYGAKEAREQRRCCYEMFTVIGLDTGELIFHEPANSVRNRG